ncbi:D-amino acid aminotransferase [soil metagenome]
MSVVLPVTQPMPADAVMTYSDYDVDWSSPFAGGCAWIEGEYVPHAHARISIFDAGYGHSDVTYTVAAVWHGQVFRLDDHLERLLDGAARTRLPVPLSYNEIRDIALGVVERSQLREAFLHISVTRGFGTVPGEKDLSQLTPQVYVYAIPYLWVFPPHQQMDGAGAIVPRHVRRAGRNTVDPTIKNHQWGDLTASQWEAADRGADTAILLDADNCVAEGPGFNVFVVKDGALATPSRNCLPGITRRTVLEIAAKLGIPASVRDVTSRELYAADELFATTTAGGVTPITSLDGVPLGSGGPGPVTTRLRNRYWAGLDETSPLLTPVDYGQTATDSPPLKSRRT